MEIGELNSDLYFKYANNIYIKKKGSTNEYIQFFDSEGNPAIQLKNVIKSSDPSGTNAPDGIYYYNNKLYIKVGGNIIDLSLLESSLPEGSIIMYQGTSAPEGWSNYGGDTGISGVMYITNGNSTIKPLAVITKDPEPINGLKYNGNEQTLATKGTASGGTIYYSLLENGTYSLDVPKGKDISNYYIWYYAKADSEHRDSAKKHIECFITKKDDVVLTSDMITISGTYTYNSEALTPTYTVKNGSDNLTKGMHFIESLSNNIKAGEATLTISAITNSGYTGSATKNFTINRKSLNSTDISIGTIPDLTYTGKEVKPTITVKDGLSKTLTLDTDYTIAYNNNINSSTEATVIITGKGNYKDEKQGKFTIKTNTATKTNPLGKTGLTYNGNVQDLIIPGSSSNGTFTYSTTLDGTYSSTIPQGTDAKSYTVYWKFEGKPGYNNDSGSISSISIAKANITPTVSMTGWTEGGEASTPSVEGNPGNGAVTYLYKVKDAADSTYSSTKPTTAGEYTIKVTITATANYNEGTATTNFTISKKLSSGRASAAKYTYELLRTGFNTVLSNLNKSLLTENDNADKYLKSMYNAADTEWKNNDSDLFKTSTYPEIYSGNDYRGTDTSKQELTYKAMQLWLAAMCLSELIPSSGDENNNQTALFKYAYNESQGSSTPLYGGYAIDADPMIGRLAAGAIYAKNHDAKASDITSARSTLGGSTINASNWSGLGYQPQGVTYKQPMTTCGYLVNTFDFLPGSFGPFASSNVPSGFPYSQPSDQYIDSDSDFWKIKNYKVDINIDKHITQTYIAYTPSGDSYIFKTPGNASEKEINLRLVEAGFIPQSTDFAYFGRKKLKYTGTIDVTIGGNKVSLHRFTETSDSVDNTNDVYDYVGPFASLMNIMFSGSNTRTTTNTIDKTTVSQTSTVYNRTSYMTFLEKVMDIADNSRYPTISKYKRKRPNGGQYTNQNRAATQQDTLGGFECGSLSALSATDAEYASGDFAKWGSSEKQDDYPGDNYGNSYPSGHSAQAWTLAMYLGLMKPSSIIEFMTNAYRFTVNRSIAKFHWNSDLIYGRLFGTMTIPIINAMSGLSSDYNSVKNTVNSGVTPTGGTVTVEYDSYPGGGQISSNNIKVIIKNNSDQSITNLFSFDFVNDTIGSGNFIELWPLQYIDPKSTIEKTIEVSYKSQHFGKSIESASIYNVDNGQYIPCNAFSGSPVFNGGSTITLVYGGDESSTVVTGGGNGGEVSTTQIKFVLNNTNGTSAITGDASINFLVVDNSSTVKTGRVTLDKEINVAAGSSDTFIGTLTDSSKIGKLFATDYTSDDDKFSSNIIFYSNGTSQYDLAIPAIDPTAATLGFKAGATYTMTIGSGVTPIPPSDDKILFGRVNITIVNNSGVDLTNEMNAVMLVYYWPSGAANHINASVALKDNSSESDVTYVEDGNPNCRSEIILGDLSNGKPVTFENACFGAWTSNSSEYVPVNGISLETPKDDDDDKPGNVKFFIKLYSNFDYNVLKDVNYSLKGIITGEDGIFKNGGTYTVTIDSYTNKFTQS